MMAVSNAKISHYLTLNPSWRKTSYQLLVDETTQSVKGDMSHDMLLCGFIIAISYKYILFAKKSQCLVGT